jgi:hypothetical protein
MNDCVGRAACISYPASYPIPTPRALLPRLKFIESPPLEWPLGDRRWELLPQLAGKSSSECAT